MLKFGGQNNFNTVGSGPWPEFIQISGRWTRNGLDFALEALGLQDNPALRDRLLHLYWELQAYPEVSQMLQDLKAGEVKTAILSNGSPDMLGGAVRSAGIGNSLDSILSVEKVGVFKPHKSVYGLVEKQFSCLKEEVLFVSSELLGCSSRCRLWISDGLGQPRRPTLWSVCLGYLTIL